MDYIFSRTVSKVGNLTFIKIKQYAQSPAIADVQSPPVRFTIHDSSVKFIPRTIRFEVINFEEVYYHALSLFVMSTFSKKVTISSYVAPPSDTFLLTRKDPNANRLGPFSLILIGIIATTMLITVC